MLKPIYVVNVFSEVGIRGGNQLAVILDASDLATEQMQAITRQMNYSESTFVTSQNNDAISFRIFVPTSEIPFAGHPTIGTCYLLEYLDRFEGNVARRSVLAKLKGGDITINIESRENTIEIVYMEQLPVNNLGDFDQPNLLLESTLLNDKAIAAECLTIALECFQNRAA